MSYTLIMCMLLQGTCVGSLDSVEMLFKFIAPLVQEGEDDDDMDEEVRRVMRQFVLKPDVGCTSATTHGLVQSVAAVVPKFSLFAMIRNTLRNCRARAYLTLSHNKL
jgi:hypothetical protein